jgi:DNA-directed RNA polymerase subunit RPC12/RpoP
MNSKYCIIEMWKKMDLHHCFTIQNQKTQCLRCSTPLNNSKWDNVHEGIQLYKSTLCPCCDYKIIIPVNFLGSGHDNWDGEHSWMSESNIVIPKNKQKIKTLESQVKILSEKSYN